MDAGVVADFRPRAFAARTAAENFQNGGLAPVGPAETSRLPVATRPPQPKAARGRLRRRRSSPMRRGIAFVAAPGIRPRGARNAAPHPSSAACWPAATAAMLRRRARPPGPAGSDMVCPAT